MQQLIPNEQLADQVIESLIKTGLLKEARRQEVRKALISGKARIEDWRIWAEDCLKEARLDGEETTHQKS